MNIITNIFESFYRYAIRKEIVIKAILLLEMISIFVELTVTSAKSYGSNITKKEFRNFQFGDNYSLYLLYISPYFLVKNIYECKIYDKEELCYFSDNFFLAMAIIVITLFIWIYFINYRKDIYYSRLLDTGFGFYIKKVLYNLVDIFIFKIFSFSLFYLFINKIMTSFVSYLYNDYISIIYIILSAVCIVLFIISNFCYIKYFNLIIQIEENYHHDNMFSIKYDFFLLGMKIILAIENSIANFDKNNSLQIRMINYLILLYSYFFILYMINSCIYGHIMFIINFSLNKFRIFLILCSNLNIAFYLVLYSKEFSYEQGILTILIFISIILLSMVLTNKIMNINLSNIYFTDQLVLTVLHIINEFYRYNFEIDLTSKTFNRKILDKKELINAKILFESKIHNTFLNHKFKCIMQECLICKAKDLTFENLVLTFEKQVEYMVEDIRYRKRLSIYSIQCLELLKLLYIQNNEKEKKVKLLYLTKHSMTANRRNYGLLNNIVVFFTYINKEIISTRKFVLLKNYYETNLYFKEIIDHLEDIIICFVAQNNKDLNKAIYDVSLLKEKIDNNITFFSKYKSIYVDEYNLTIIKYMYESLFNSRSSESLNMYNLELMEDKLEQSFSTDRLMVLDFATETNILKILKSSQEFNEYNNGRFALMFPTDLRKSAEDELVKKINNSDNLSFKFEYIANNYSYIRLFKLIRGYILPSIKENYLMITSEYDVDDHEIILLEGPQELEFDKDNVGKFFISNFTYDLGEMFYLNPTWLKVVRNTRFLWRTQFDQFFNIETKTGTNDIHVFFNYKKYIEVYNNIISVLKEFPDYSTNEVKAQHKQNLANIVKFASEDKTLHFKLIKSLDIKSGIRKYLAVKIVQDINSHVEEQISLLHNKNLNDSRHGTIITASSTKSLTTMSNKKLTESNNLTLSRYTKCTLIFNVCLIIYCLIYLIIGIDNNKRFDRLYETRIKFLSVKNNIQHTYLSLFFSIYIMDENTKKKSHYHDNTKYGIDLHEYVNSEVTHKINFVTEVITQYESSVYSYKYNNRLKDLFEIQSEYEYYAIIDDIVKIKKKEVNFLYILKQFANNCKVIDENKSGSLIMYLINIENDQMKFPDYVDINNIPRYIFTMYELILNYNKYLNLIAKVEKEIDDEHLENMKLLFMVNFNLTLVLILVHFVLIFICYRIIITIRTILSDNNRIINSIMQNDNIKFIKTKFTNLKKLSELYATNPVTIFNNLKGNSNEYHQLSKLEKSRENKTNNEKNQVQINKSFHFKINFMKIINNFSNILIVTFTVYFIYSIALYMIFYSTYLSIRDTTDYLFYYSKVVNSIYNNAVMLKTSMMLNRTDNDIARNFYKDENIRNGFIQDNINQFFTLENELKKSRLIPAVNYHYRKAEKELMNCETNYDLFNDELIRRSTIDKPDILRGIKNVCKNIPIMKTDLDQLYNDIIYNYQKILIQYNSSKREYKKVKNIFKEDSILENLFMLLLFVFRPIEVYLTLTVNRNTITEVNQNYLTFTFIYLSLNILVDVFLCIIIYILILKKTAIINRYYNSLIGCLRV